MENSKIFLVKRSTFTKAILFGHVLNIVIGVLVFCLCHYLLDYSAELSVILTVAGTLIGAILTSLLGTERLSRPMSALSSEISKLNDKVNASHSALSVISEDTKALMDDLPLGILVFDQKTELTRINKVGITMLGITDVTLPTTKSIIATISALRSNGEPINFIDWLHQAKTDKIQDLKRWPMVLVQTEKTRYMCDLLAHYNKNDSHAYELVLMLVDRSEEYDYQEKQMEFVSLAAHELRGPITIMRGLIDIFQDEISPNLSAEDKELVTRMSVSARQLAGYINNILNVSHVERDTFEVNPDEEQWGPILTQASADMIIRAKARHRKLEIHIPKVLPTVAVDTTTIDHVITNLIDNAIKYSHEDGTIIVNVTQKEDMVETTIQDFGLGIPENLLANLFTKFYRSHHSNRAVSGTGLGLYLCKAIIEAHGGNIWVRSKEGMGSTFGFTLPTYASVADQLKAGNNTSGIIRSSHGWIKNHSLYQR